MEWIGVVDCNNFFVSCERLFRPDLRKRPVIVLSSNDGCVVARSQEVKDMGVPMGVPYFKIKDIVKDNGVVTFSSHFTLYRDISSRVFNLLREELTCVEQYSIDEAFFTINGSEAEVQARVTQIKQRIERNVGIPVSIGVAATKTLAKLAVDQAKKTTGVSVISKTTWQAMSHETPLVEVWGVGRKLSARFTALGVHTVGSLMATEPVVIEKHFGVVGLRLQAELSGQSAYPVTPHQESQQSIMSSRSFKDANSDLAVLEDAIAFHVRSIAADLRRMNKVVAVLRVSIRPSRFSSYLLRGGTVECVLEVPSNDTIDLLVAAQQGLKVLYEPGVPYKKAGVSAPYLLKPEALQPALFAPTATPQRSELMALIDMLNERAGHEVLGIGNRQKGVSWHAKRTHTSPAYTTQWNDVASVRADS